MEIKFREWSELTDDERVDGIYTARAWVRNEFPLLLPVDITPDCKAKFIDAAEKAERFSQSCKRTLEAMQ